MPKHCRARSPPGGRAATAVEDPKLERLKDRWRRSRGAHPTWLHTLSCLVLIAGAGLLVAGAFRPWVVLDGQAYAAMTPGGGADEALASLFLGIAAIDIGLAVFVLVAGRVTGKARMIHALSILLSAISLILLLPRIRVDEHQTFLARLDSGGSDSYLGSGLYLTCIGLAVTAAAPLVAFPEILRAMRS